ncbi:N-acetylmuramoyl-L-alanine amidase [Rhizobium sp. TH2]|uniref:N-acetylmuramoyl-L-alanine amidase n=1 Tax=Rhizobium sp. TH2 TaxID=2775403 RepID=UPI0035BE3876
MLKLTARLLLPVLCVLAVMAHAQTAPEPLIAYAARIAGDDARTRVVIDFDRKPEFSLHYTAQPNRLIIDLGETAFGFSEDDLKAIGLFSEIRYGRMGEGASRIVLTARRPTRAVLAEVQPNEPGKGFRLVLDCEVISEPALQALVAEQKWVGAEKVAGGKTDRIATTPEPAADNKFLIAIDAGHGGIDAGAKGTLTKIEEKAVTLDFATTLAARLNKEKGIKAFLTRDKDEFISLSERVVIARQRGAQLFISLHADTLRQKDIRGATIYTISDKASDALAAGLAERENLSDGIAGVEIADEPTEVTDILLDLTRRETQAFSIRMAETVLDSFDGQIGLINNPLRHAGFRVLQAPDVPSVLLELGFLSNPKDELLLTDPEWREKVSDLLAEAIGKYMESAGVARGG